MVPLLSERCACGSPGTRISISPPADIRICSKAGRELLKELFLRDYGFADFLEGRIILLNKIAGIDRRDQVFIEGRHIATLWFDITTGSHRLDLEIGGAALLAQAQGVDKNVLTCNEKLLKGHIKGKWIPKESIQKDIQSDIHSDNQSNTQSDTQNDNQTDNQRDNQSGIQSQNVGGLPESLCVGDNVILRIGKFSGVGVVRRRQDGSKSIRILDVTQKEFRLSDRRASLEDVIRANEPHLKRMEKTALGELRDFLSRTRLPVNVSFSGGKDSLAALCLCLKVRPRPDVLFIDTGLEFPETVKYVRRLSDLKKLKLHVIEGQGDFFQEAKSFGPPSKDFRWCCKTHKLGPLASFIKEHYPKGCVTVEGRRIYESFNRSRINFIERNPYVPGQTTLCPIRNWNALEVMLYIYWNGLEPNPLYDEDFERIGCWLCPASLQSEFVSLEKTHPQMYGQWTAFLRDWADKKNLDPRYADWGFWRWRKHPPKMLEIAKAHDIDLLITSGEKKEVGLDVVRGKSPCGLEYSIEANLTVPQNHPFPAVANALAMIGDVKYSEDLGTAVVKADWGKDGDMGKGKDKDKDKDKGRCTVFASGHIMIIAQKKEAEELLKKVVETVLRVQTCTRCGICEKRCKRGAIKVRDTITIDEKRCNRCGRCAVGCIVAERAAKILRRGASA